MRFDMVAPLQVPAFMGLDAPEVFRNSLDEIALADQAGFGGVWLLEHHFMPEFSQCSAPEVMFGAISQRTRNMRLGSAVTVLTINHPVRVAERVATLDVLTGGRIDLGVGRGNWAVDYEVFGGGATMAEGRGRVAESIEIMKRCWAGEPFAWDGEFWKFPEVNVYPKPIQQPHPKLWAAAVSPESYTNAAEQGMAVLAGPFKPLFMVAEDRQRFVDRCAELGRDHRELGFAMAMGIVCADDHDHAIELASRNLRWYFEQLLTLTAPLLTRQEKDYHYYREEIATLRSLTGGSPSLEALQSAGMLIAGDPDHVVEQLHNLVGHGIDHVMCTLQAGGIPHKDVMRSIELIGEQVIPRMRDVTADGKRRKLPKRDLTVWLRDAPDVTPELLFESMRMVFRRDLADGFKALYRVDLDGDGGGTWFIDVADGDCQVLKDKPGRDPDVRIKSDTGTWMEIAKGERGQASALLTRRLKIAGNPLKAARFKSLFS